MARGRSKREVEVLVARLAPRPDVPSSVRKLPAPVRARAAVAAAVPEKPPTGLAKEQPAGSVEEQPAGSAEEQPAGSAREQPPASLTQPDACAPALPPETAVAGTSGIRAVEMLRTPPPSGEAVVGRPAHRPVVTPLAPGRYCVKFTVGEETHEKLRRVQDLLRREIPDGDPGAIFDRALTLLLEDIGRKKLAETTRPRPAAAPAKGSREVPASVKRAVWRRDAGQCAFVAANGRRCTERAFLEFHHEEPYARGGGPTVRNIELRCARHHAYETERTFGPRIVSLEREPGDGRCEPYRHRREGQADRTERLAERAEPQAEKTDSPRDELQASQGGCESTPP